VRRARNLASGGATIQGVFANDSGTPEREASAAIAQAADAAGAPTLPVVPGSPGNPIVFGVGDDGGTGPIDASGAPTQLVMSCQGTGAPSTLAFKLPCAVGLAPLEVTECYALGENTSPVLNFILPLGFLASHLGEPISLDHVPREPGGSPLIEGEITYSLASVGPLTVTQVDTVGRAYVGRLDVVEFTSVTEASVSIVCSARGATIWALPGSFF